MNNKLKNLFKIASQKGFFHLLSANYLNGFFLFCSQLFVAHLLSPVDIGIIKILQSYASIAFIFAGLGFNTSVLKLCSETRTPAEKALLFQKAFLYSIFSMLVAYVLMLSLSILHILSNDPMVNRYAPYYFIVIIPMTLNALLLAYFQSLNQFKLVARTQFIISLTNIILVIVLTYFYHLWGYIVSLIFSFTFGIWFLLAKLNWLEIFKQKSIETINCFKLHFSLAKYAVLANGVGKLVACVDIFIINFMVADKNLIGQYAFATIFIIGFGIITQTLQQMITPSLSEKSHNFKEWISLLNNYNKILMVATLLLTIMGCILIPIFIKLFFGQYTQSITLFYILIIGWAFMNLASFRGIGFLSYGKSNFNFYNSLIILCINLVITIFLTRKYGIYGAAIGNAFTFFAGYGITYLSFNFFLRKIRDNTQITSETIKLRQA